MALTQPIEDYYPVHPRFINHDILHCRHKAMPGDHLYSGRALAITTHYDVVQLHPQLQDEFPAICAHYDRVGLGYSNQIIWNLDFAERQNYANYEASYFYFGKTPHRVARNENWFAVVGYINSNSNFMTLAGQLGMRVPKIWTLEHAGQIDKATLAQVSYPCLLKAASRVPGIWACRCEDAAQLKQALAYFGPHTPLQIQPIVNVAARLNLQYQVVGARLERLAACEQLQDGGGGGSRFPTPHHAWHCVEPMATWLFSQGMRGNFAFDVAVVKDNCGAEYLPVACQPHYTDAAYPALIARKLAIPHWQTRSYDTRYRRLAELPLRELEFNAATQSGVVLVNWGPVLVGKLQFLIAGTPAQQQALCAELERRL